MIKNNLFCKAHILMSRFVVAGFLWLGMGAPLMAQSYQLDKFIDGLEKPWALAFLPNGDMLFTEWKGTLRHVKNGALVSAPIGGVPEAYVAGQGGLMDIVLHPDFEHNRLVYLSLAIGNGKANRLRIIRGRLEVGRLENIQTVFESAPDKQPPVHYGGRMAFLPDKTLLITVGDGFNYREEAQNIGNHFGTIVRVADAGKIPRDNPFVDDERAQPEIWSYGHRNAQSLIYDAMSDSVFQTEHGPQGGDELNHIKRGKNYGWPIATYGLNYSGARVSPYREYPNTESPLLHWTPSIGPSGMMLYDGPQFPEWRGDIFVTSLVFEYAIRVDMKGVHPTGEQEIIFAEIGARLRDIRMGPDGAIYILAEESADNAGAIYRVTKK